MDTIGSKVLLYVDESYNDEFCGVCIVYIQEENNLEILKEQVRKINLDPAVRIYGTADTFHYNEDTIGKRQSLASWISKMPISAHIGIIKNDIPKNKKDRDDLAYNVIFPKLLKPLIMKFTKKFNAKFNLDIRFENLSDKKTQDMFFFKTVLDGIPNYKDNSFSVVTKDSDQLVFLPDYFLGFIRDNFSRSKNKTWPTDSLKLLSAKIGVILLQDKEKSKLYERGKEIFDFLC